MANSRDYLDHVLELIRPAGSASSRAMFGGHGIYLDGMIVAIVVDDTLYLKADDETRAAFIAQDLEPFRFTKKKTGEVLTTSYHRPPDEALESPAAMREWVRRALSAALRTAARKSGKAKPGSPRARRPR